MFFDKPSNTTLYEWRNSAAYFLLNSKLRVRPVNWVYVEDLTDDDKINNPEHKILSGYLKEVGNYEYSIEEWKSFCDREKEIIKSIPNFDSEKFYKITGIDVEKD